MAGLGQITNLQYPEVVDPVTAFNLLITIKNIGDMADDFAVDVTDIDTGGKIGGTDWATLSAGHSHTVTRSLTMPSKNWNLRIDVSRFV